MIYSIQAFNKTPKIRSILIKQSLRQVALHRPEQIHNNMDIQLPQISSVFDVNWMINEGEEVVDNSDNIKKANFNAASKKDNENSAAEFPLGSVVYLDRSYFEDQIRSSATSSSSSGSSISSTSTSNSSSDAASRGLLGSYVFFDEYLFSSKMTQPEIVTTSNVKKSNNSSSTMTLSLGSYVYVDMSLFNDNDHGNSDRKEGESEFSCSTSSNSNIRDEMRENKSEIRRVNDTETLPICGKGIYMDLLSFNSAATASITASKENKECNHYLHNHDDDSALLKKLSILW
jgi:hypothetical protein